MSIESFWIRAAKERSDNANFNDETLLRDISNQVKHGIEVYSNRAHQTQVENMMTKKSSKTARLTMALNFYNVGQKKNGLNNSSPSQPSSSSSKAPTSTAGGDKKSANAVVSQKRSRKSFVKPTLVKKDNKVYASVTDGITENTSQKDKKRRSKA
jgi:hypothetical protein